MSLIAFLSEMSGDEMRGDERLPVSTFANILKKYNVLFDIMMVAS
jgi:hypothetical protein